MKGPWSETESESRQLVGRVAAAAQYDNTALTLTSSRGRPSDATEPSQLALGVTAHRFLMEEMELLQLAAPPASSGCNPRAAHVTGTRTLRHHSPHHAF